MTFYPTEMPIMLWSNHRDLWQTLCVLSDNKFQYWQRTIINQKDYN